MKFIPISVNILLVNLKVAEDTSEIGADFLNETGCILVREIQINHLIIVENNLQEEK